jgi:hypothetical protein
MRKNGKDTKKSIHGLKKGGPKNFHQHVCFLHGHLKAVISVGQFGTMPAKLPPKIAINRTSLKSFDVVPRAFVLG